MFEVVFQYVDSNGVPITGANPSIFACYVAKDTGPVVLATDQVGEINAALIPGTYSFTLTTTETDADCVKWFIKTTSVGGYVIAYGSEHTIATPWTGDKAETVNTIADGVLRRSLSSAELSLDGDTVQLQSLLGAVLVHVNGQPVQCNADQTECYLPIHKVSGGLLGSIALRVVNGNVVGNCNCS